MSRKVENQCVECPKEMGCIGESCRYKNVIVDYCDICGDENAEYQIDNEDYCKECLKEYLQEAFDELTLSEKASLLKIKVRRI